MTTTHATRPTATLRALIDGKTAQIKAQDARLDKLESDLASTVMAGGDTATIRAQITKAEERLWRLGIERQRLEEQLPYEEERHRAAHAALADLYRADLAFLCQRAKVLRLRAALRAEEDELGRLHSATGRDHHGQHHLRPIALARFGLAEMPRDRHEVARLTLDERMPKVEAPAGAANDGGNTLAEIDADIERYQELIRDAEDASK